RLRELRAGVDAQHALPVALQAEQPLALARAQEVEDAAESELALVERLVDAPQVLAHLADVHRPAWRLLRPREEPRRVGDDLRRLLLGQLGPAVAGRAVAVLVNRLRLRRRGLGGRLRSLAAVRRVGLGLALLGELHEDAASRLPQRDDALGGDLLDEVAE